MPNMKNAKKAVKTNAKKTVTNNNLNASIKTAIKKVEKAVSSKDKDNAKETLKTAIKQLDKAVSSGTKSKNARARKKSRLTKKVNAME